MEDRSGFFFRVGKDDPLILEVMAYFQKQGRGKLSRALRDGLRLFWDLSHQRTDVLVELFPFVKDAICPPTDSSDMERRIADAVASRLKGELQQQGRGIPDSRDVGLPLFKAIGGTQPAAPKPEIKQATMATAEEISDNFLAFIQ